MPLLDAIEKLKKSEISALVDARMAEFKLLGEKPTDEIFKELCFCILCANFNAERGIKIQEEIGNGFILLSKSKLSKKLKEIGYRYPNTRARYILEARKFKNSLKGIMSSSENQIDLRDWLSKNVTGLGRKESSHFLRNVGYTNCAIIDFHILDILARWGLIKKPKTLTGKKYIEIENVLREIAEKSKLNLAQLDLYLWYMETGKVLK